MGMRTHYCEEGTQMTCPGFFNPKSWVTNYTINENYQRVAAAIWGGEFMVSTIIGLAAGDPSTAAGRVGILVASWTGWGVLSVVESHLFYNRAVKHLHSQAIEEIQTQDKPDAFAVEALFNDGHAHGFLLRDGGKGIQKLINIGDKALLNKTTDRNHKILDVVSSWYGQEKNIKALVAAGAEFGSEKFKNLSKAVQGNQFEMVKELLMDDYTDEQKQELAKKCNSIKMFEYLEKEVGVEIDPLNEEIARLKRSSLRWEKESRLKKEEIAAYLARRHLLV